MPIGKLHRLPETEDGLYDAMAERIRARLSPGMNVIELGCGVGQLTLPLCGGVALWEATDSDADKINVCLSANTCTFPYRTRKVCPMNTLPLMRL